MKFLALPTLTIALLFTFACSEKGDDPAAPAVEKCASLTTIKATSSATTIEKGQTLNFQAQSVEGVTYKWKIPGANELTTNTGSVQNIDFTNEGWFLLHASNSCKEIKKDSFFVDVKIPAGVPGCTPTPNTISFTAENHKTGTFTTITQGESQIANDAYYMRANGGGNELSIAFHPSYKNNKQPEDGVYTTGTFSATGYPSFGEKDFDKVFIVDITYSPSTIYYRSTPGQKVYISRVNGKMKATVCNIPLTGSSNGTPYATNMSLSVTEQ
ncbi:hypothetical protein WG947_08215 [Pontibacter sp. H259]|uniref:hypothetical protein n=1 Tax=Pontibacter sp. H259 TaxID=3133421 RepID=UPI0030C001E6